MMPRKTLSTISLSLLLALVIAQPALAGSNPLQASATLGVSLSFSPNPVTQFAPTTGSYAISGGTAPFTIWMNGTPSGCYPPGNPFTTSNASDTFTCSPSVTGTFYVHVDVHDSAGNAGSTQTTLTVSSGSGGSGGSGSGTGNNTGGIDLSFLQNLLPVLMITGILFLGSVVAIAVSSVALAILVPRRLKQLRKAIEGQPIRKTDVPATPPPPPKEQPPGGEL